ncbi:DegT/DnrJ/EryC1/StrS family aminotransferase [bacterium]|nr:DegT/DnrJ/EryC1/StrS family aminotransferase [bacterium]
MNKVKIPLIDLNAQYKSIKKEVDIAIRRVLDSTCFILGPEVEAFEKEIAHYCRVKFAVGVGSGTDALLLALMAYDIGPGDEVLTVPFTFTATVEAIILRGAKPVFIDIDLKSYNIDVKKIEEKITSKTKAIIPVHLYGQPAEMDSILKIAKKYKLKIIEDAAQAIGARYSGLIAKEKGKGKGQGKGNKEERVGAMGDIGCLSFFPSKNLGGYGDGGMILTNNKKIAVKIKMLHQHGSMKKYKHTLVGCNSRLDALQAAVLRVKLKNLNKWIDKRIEIAKMYNSLLKETGVILPIADRGVKHVYNQYTIRVKNRDKVKRLLAEEGIATAIHYPLPLHLQKAFKFLGYKKGDFPQSEQAAKEVLSLPMCPELNKLQVKLVSETIKKKVRVLDKKG